MYEHPPNKKKYLNVGNLKENIQNLKKENKLKSKEKVDRFYKLQSRVKDKTLPTNTFDENLHKTLSSFYLSMKSDPMTFYRGGTNKSLNRYETQTSTFLNFPSRTSYNHDRDKESENGNNNIEPLMNLYHMYDDSRSNSLFNKKEKHDLLKTFHIHPDLDRSEKRLIDTSLKTRSDFYSTNRNFNKTQSSASTYYFMNPEKSFKKLKLNRLIYSSIMNIRTSQQLKDYSIKAEQEYDRYIKVSQMPKVKVNLRKPMNFEYLDNSTIEQEDQSTQRHWTRNQYMDSDINYELTYFSENYNDRPDSRSLFTLTLADSVMYMFGGLKNQKLNEIWKCEIKSKCLLKFRELPMDKNTCG
jgi:hypothetical protein